MVRTYYDCRIKTMAPGIRNGDIVVTGNEVYNVSIWMHGKLFGVPDEMAHAVLAQVANDDAAELDDLLGTQDDASYRGGY